MKKRIYVGVESFERLREEDCFYIDKTLFIQELLEKKSAVTLITRPRRFGKTLNMSMLQSFFDIGRDSKAFFDGLAIAEQQDLCEEHMNKYPVVSLTMKNVEQDTFESSIGRIRSLVSAVLRQNRFLFESDKLDEHQKSVLYALLTENATEVALQNSLLYLTECLYAYHKKRVIVLLDEYDSPIDNSERHGYYDKMINFMRGFLGSVFKTNDYLEFGVLTGVQRVSKEGLFSSFNNPKIRGVLDEEFSSCFGFSEDEVKAACEMYEISDRYDEIKSWYDGYRFGGQDIYNPWSITMYLDSQKLENYWVNTGSVHVIKDVFHKGDDRLRDDMAGLLTGSPITMSLADHITYPIKYASTNTFWTLLLHAGYLKPVGGAKGGVFQAELVNMEVGDTFSYFAKEWLEEERSAVSESIQNFITNLLGGNPEGVSKALNEDLLGNPSSFDFLSENSYHMFIYGMLLANTGSYTVHSNRESGKGRFDCLIKPLDKNEPAALMEFKHLGTESGDLVEEAQKALEQIEEKQYIHSLIAEGYTQIYKYGIAFHKKTSVVVMGNEAKK